MMFYYRLTIYLITILSLTSISISLYAQDLDGDGIADNVDLDDDNDGIPDLIECGIDPNCAEVRNSSFELPPVAPGNLIITDASNVPNWGSTATDNNIEVWNNFEGIVPFDGRQHIELNARLTGGVFQDICVVPGEVLRWSVAHRARRPGTDVMEVLIGDPNGGLQSQGRFSAQRTAWVVHSGFYTVPAGVNTIRITFNAVSTSTNDITVGNLIDDVRLSVFSFPCRDTDGDGIVNKDDLDSDNDGCPDAFEAGVSPNTNLVNGIDIGNNNMPLRNAFFPPSVAVGSNGLANEVEQNPDSGEIGYSESYNNALNANVNNCPQCDLTSLGITNVACNDNGTPSDGTDDFITFSLNPQGTILGTSYTVQTDASSITPMMGNYGIATNFTLPTGTANGQNITITIRDAFDTNCTISGSVSIASCSDLCRMDNLALDNISCNDNNTPADPSDDFISFELNPTGVNLAAGYTVSSTDILPIQPNNANYGSASNFRLPAGTADNITIYNIAVADQSDAACMLTTSIGPVATCSPVICLISCPADVTIACDADTSIAANGIAEPVPGTNIMDIWHRDIWIEGECEDIIRRRWYGRGICEEIDSCDQLITIRDMENPTFSNSNTTFFSSCDYEIPPISPSDNCGIKRIDTVIEELSRTCPNTYTDRITFTAFDSCDLTAELIYTMEVSDTEPPSLGAGQWNTTVTDQSICRVPPFSSTEEIRSTTGREVTDNCSGDIAVNFREELLPDDDCGPRTIRRYYTFRDVCQNTSEEFVQDIVYDVPCTELDSYGEISINGNTRQYLSSGCLGSNTTVETAAAGVCGYLEYMWLVSTFERAPGIPFVPTQSNLGTIWNEVPNEFEATLNPGKITQNTYFVRCVRNFTCCDFQESNIVAYLIDDEEDCPPVRAQASNCDEAIQLMRPMQLDATEYETDSTIESDIFIQNNSAIYFDAARGTVLYPGFEVESQGALSIDTNGCE